MNSVAAPDAAADLAPEIERVLARLLVGLFRAEKGELSRTAASVLARVRDEGPQRVTDLATSESVAQPSMTTLVARLVGQGLVTRDPDPDDARAVRVSLTDAGREALARRSARRAAAMEARLEHLSAAERQTLAAALPVLERLSHPEEDLR
ncbi:MAG: MarR family winged helix-turn-helix transcriptional regulator [Solirubrobacteraceae bacterium]